MKKCSYCAETIQEEAIVCRYCGRNLVSDVEMVASASKIAGEASHGKKREFTLNDTFELLQKWGQSYATLDTEPLQIMMGILKQFNLAAFQPMWVYYIDSNLLPPQEFKALSVQALNNTVALATLCVAVGVECGRGLVPRSMVATYLAALSRPHEAAISGWLEPLFAKRKINSKHAEAIAVQVHNSMTEAYVKFEDLGFRASFSARPKEGLVGQSPFLEALLQLNASTPIR